MKYFCDHLLPVGTGLGRLKVGTGLGRLKVGTGLGKLSSIVWLEFAGLEYNALK